MVGSGQFRKERGRDSNRRLKGNKDGAAFNGPREKEKEAAIDKRSRGEQVVYRRKGNVFSFSSSSMVTRVCRVPTTYHFLWWETPFIS